MKLSIDFFSKKEPPSSSTYFGLFLKENEGIAFFISKEGGKLHIDEQERFNFTNSWENLAEDVDEVLYKLETKTKKSPQEAIFFLYSHLVDEKSKEIRKPYLGKIKDLIKKLEFKPMGYVECHEGVVDYLSKKEDMPLSAVLLEFDKTKLDVFVYKAGRLIFEDCILRSSNLIDDLLESFGKIAGKIVLPSRVILYNSKDLDFESSKILTHQWKENLFIQLPKVETIKEEDLIASLVDVFSTQILSKESARELEQVDRKEEVMGFVIGGDVVPQTQDTPQMPGEPRFLSSFFNLDTIRDFLSKIKLPNIPDFNFPKTPINPFFIGAIAFLLVLFLSEYFFHKARVEVFLPSKQIKEDINIVADKNAKSSKELKLYQQSQTKELSDSKPTTGKKETGEKAKGEITIHSFDDKEKIFDKGTVIEATGVKFILSDEVKVASASLASDGSAKLPGKAKVKIEAQQIGPESNLTKGQRFKLGSLPPADYFGINDNALSGGTKKDIRTVSKSDVDELRNGLSGKAEKEVEQKDEKFKKENRIIKKLTEVEFEDENFSHEVGEEIDSLQLKAKIKITYLFYKQNDILDKISSSLKSSIDPGFEVAKERIDYSIKDVAKKNDKFTLNLKVNTKSTKKISEEEVIKKITKKNRSKAQAVLEDDYEAESVDFNISHMLPFLENIMPFFKKNIELKISYQ